MVRLGVDVGGTFTDVVLVGEGDLTTTKVPTTPGDQSQGVLSGIAEACDEAGIEPSDVDGFRHAMTVATNALLEGTGATSALVTTAGFADVLEIGRQNRPALYDINATKPEPLVPAERRFEIAERATPEGIEEPVDVDAVESLVGDIPEAVESVAVCLLHAYAHPENEQRVADVLRDRLDASVVASHEVLATFREYERTSTTVADAAVTPPIRTYVGNLADAAASRGLPEPWVMQSNGGIAHEATIRDHAVTTALSGPAAGVVGASLFEPADVDGIVSFDMGGTSTDVGLVREGDVERTTDASVGGHPIGVPMVDVETVGAGGGSIARIDEGGALRVGPDSAGAEPGPACYGRGGTEPTVTDACLELGFLGEGRELGGEVSLDAAAARDALEDLASAGGMADSVAAAHGIYRVASARTAQAIRRVTVERGHDPRGLDLVGFGGAGPMFAAALADQLGIERVRVPRANGVLSAVGLLAADEHHDALRTHRTKLADADPATVESMLSDLVETVRDRATAPEGATITRAADLRYAGQSHELTVTLPPAFDAADVAERFHREHDRARGYLMDDEPIEIVSLRAAATVTGTPPDLSHEGETAEPRETRDVHFEDDIHETPVYDRDGLPVGATLAGPAIYEGGESTVVVPPAWRTRVDDQGTLILEASV